MEGTEIIIDEKKILSLPNFTQKDFKFRNEICSSGFKHYSTTKDAKEYLLIEAKIGNLLNE